MTSSSMQEYTEAGRGRYLQASKVEKGKNLDEFTKVIGYRRKVAICPLRRGNQPMSDKKRGHPRQYGATVVRVLRVVWEATDRLCSKRLNLFLKIVPGWLINDSISHLDIRHLANYYLVSWFSAVYGVVSQQYRGKQDSSSSVRNVKYYGRLSDQDGFVGWGSGSQSPNDIHW